MDSSQDDSFVYEKIHQLLTTESANKERFNLEELGLVVENFDKYSSISNVDRSSNLILKLAERLVIHGCVPNFEHSEERDFDEKDFPGVAESAIICFSHLKSLLNRVKDMENVKKHSFICDVLILIAVHHHKYLWSSEGSITASSRFFDEMKTVINFKDLSSLLCSENFKPSIFCGVLQKLKPLLLKDTWTKNPSSSPIFIFFIQYVKHPHLANYIADVFPPSLIFIDHYDPKNKVLGINCLDHIISNVPPSLLKLHGEADVMYDALRPLIFSRDLMVISVLYPCLLKLMNAQKKSTGSTSLKMWDNYDEVYNQLLLNQEIEGSIQVQRVYLSHIALYLNEISAIKHLKHTLHVVKNCLEVYDGPEEVCRIQSLKILLVLISKCWPRMKFHCEEILIMVMKFLYDTITDRGTHDSNVKINIIDLCSKCFKLLYIACPVEFLASSKSVVEEDFDIPGVDILKRVYDEN